jgi:NADH-quinone oxidoreductase subunit M
MAVAPWMAGLAAVAVCYGAVLAVWQEDLRRLVACISVSQMGVVVLGLWTLTFQGMQGAMFSLVAHALWCAGVLGVIALLAARRHTTRIADFRGLHRVMPRLSSALLVLAVAPLVVPGTPLFVVGVLTLSGVGQAAPGGPVRLLAGVAGAGMLLAAVVVVRTWRRVCRGPLSGDRNRGLRDLTAAELLIVVPPCALIVLLGWWPAPVLSAVAPPVRQAIEQGVQTRGAAGP